MTNPIDTAALRRAWGETTPDWQQRDDQTTEGWVTIIGNVDGEYHPDGSVSSSYDVVCVCEDEYGERLPNVSANARFIALAHREWPALLDRIDALEGEVERLRSALQPFAKSGELLVKAGDSGRFWAYRPAGGDEYGIAGTHLLDARTALGDPIMTWHPIDSAPKDGTVILVYSTTKPPHYDDQQYIETVCNGQHVVEVQVAKWIEEDSEWEKMYIGEPLFWMPLPEPPEQGQ